MPTGNRQGKVVLFRVFKHLADIEAGNGSGADDLGFFGSVKRFVADIARYGRRDRKLCFHWGEVFLSARRNILLDGVGQGQCPALLRTAPRKMGEPGHIPRRPSKRPSTSQRVLNEKIISIPPVAWTGHGLFPAGMLRVCAIGPSAGFRCRSPKGIGLPHAYLEVEPYLGAQELAWSGIPPREERYGQWYRFSLKIAGHRFKGLSLARMTIYDGAAPVDWLDWLSAREWKRPGLQQYGLDIGAFELPWKKLVAEVVVEAVYDDGKEETLVRRYDLLPRPEASRQCVFP